MAQTGLRSGDGSLTFHVLGEKLHFEPRRKETTAQLISNLGLSTFEKELIFTPKTETTVLIFKPIKLISVHIKISVDPGVGEDICK